MMVANGEARELKCPLCNVSVQDLVCPSCGRDLDEIGKELRKAKQKEITAFLKAAKAQKRELIEPCERISLAMRRSVIDAFERFHRTRPKTLFKGQRAEIALIDYMQNQGETNLPKKPEERRSFR